MWLFLATFEERLTRLKAACDELDVRVGPISEHKEEECKVLQVLWCIADISSNNAARKEHRIIKGGKQLGRDICHQGRTHANKHFYRRWHDDSMETLRIPKYINQRNYTWIIVAFYT